MLRTVALVAIAGQLQLLPAAIMCAAGHGQAAESHCGADSAGAAVAVTAGSDSVESPLCAWGIGCRAPAVGLLADAASGERIGDPLTVLPADSQQPASLDLSPAPPPPQA